MDQIDVSKPLVMSEGTDLPPISELAAVPGDDHEGVSTAVKKETTSSIDLLESASFTE